PPRPQVKAAAMMAMITLTTSGPRSSRRLARQSSRFQFATGPKATVSSSGTINGTNTALKYGGPTEILPSSSTSRNSGYSVPSSTAPAATVSSTLFSNRKDSRDHTWKPPPTGSFGARTAYTVNAPPTTKARNARMNTPRAGSEAKACTDTSTPERTRKVPSSDSENAAMASSTVQLRNAPRFSVTASEGSNAVPTSHGMNEAFSTGSQNHHPPQPSS